MPETRTHYVQYEDGAIQTVDHAHYEEYLLEWVNGRSYLKRGFTEYTEAEARKLNRQLFGHPDPNVEASRTQDELAREFERRRLIAEMQRFEGAE